MPDGGLGDGGIKDVLSAGDGNKDFDRIDSPVDFPVSPDAGVDLTRGEVAAQVLDAPASPSALCKIYVNQNGGSDETEGTTWAKSKATLQAGLDKAEQQGGCDVWVAKGVYKPTTGGVRSISIMLRKNIRVFGGFLGNETAFEQRDFKANETTLSGDIGVVGNATDNSYFVVTAAQGATLDGFTVTGGSYGEGSAITTGDADTAFDIANCVFKNNTAGSAAIYMCGLGSTIKDSILYGEGIRTGGGCKITIMNCSFLNGSASNAMLRIGGDYQATSKVAVLKSNFENNAGGAIFTNGGGLVQVQESTFINNPGGAISANTLDQTPNGLAKLIVSQSKFSGNKSSLPAAAIVSSDLIADRCVFINNQASKYAGAIYLTGSVNQIANSMFWGNISGSEGGGAIYLAAKTKVSISNTTMAQNTGTVGGAVFGANLTSQLTLVNSILWQNKPDEVSGGTTFATYTISLGNPFPGVGNSGSDPLFVDLVNGDLRLKPTSPALNAGTAEVAPTLDLRGVARDGLPDLGCYEGAASL